MKRYLIFLGFLFFSAPTYAAFPIHRPESPKELIIHQSGSENVRVVSARSQEEMPGRHMAGHGLATISLIFGIIGLFYFHLAFGIIALVFGAVSVRRHPLKRPMGLVGLILGVIDIVLVL